MPNKYVKSRFSTSLPLAFIIFVPLILIAPPSIQKVYAAEATFAWDANSEDAVAGYRVFCREEGESYNYDYPAWEAYVDELDDPNHPTCTVYNLYDEIPYYFVVRAFDALGNESADSNEVRYLSGVTAYGDGDGEGCFIASAASGSCAEPLMDVLRDFRDKYLLTNGPGTWFVKVYYRYGSYLADYMKTHSWCNSFVCVALTPVLGLAYILLKTSMEISFLVPLVLTAIVLSCHIRVRLSRGIRLK